MPICSFVILLTSYLPIGTLINAVTWVSAVPSTLFASAPISGFLTAAFTTSAVAPTSNSTTSLSAPPEASTPPFFSALPLVSAPLSASTPLISPLSLSVTALSSAPLFFFLSILPPPLIWLPLPSASPPPFFSTPPMPISSSSPTHLPFFCFLLPSSLPPPASPVMLLPSPLPSWTITSSFYLTP